MTISTFPTLIFLISSKARIITFVLGGRAWHNYINYYQLFVAIVIVTKANIYAGVIMDVSGTLLSISETDVIIAYPPVLKTHLVK